MNIKRGFVFKAFASLLAASALLVPASSKAADMDADGTADEADAVPCDTRASTVAFAPAQNQQGSLIFEDMWPAKGDLDFNDVSLSYNYIFFLDDAGRVSSMQASINLLAAGGTLPNSVRLHLPVAADAATLINLNGTDGVTHALTPAPNEHELVIPLIADVNAAMGDTLANTTPDKPSVAGVPLNLYIKFATPVAIDLSQAPFDLYLERVNEPGHQIHQVGYAGTDTMDTSLFGTADDGSTADRHFVDSDGLPFALSVPASFQWPTELVSISTAYPDITPWASSGGAVHADWYQTNVDPASVWTGGANGSAPPVGVVLGPTDPSEDVQCAPWKGSVAFGFGPFTIPYGSATDPSGNVIVGGYTNVNQNTTAFVTKYDSHKKEVWTKTFSGSGTTNSSATYYDSEVYGVATDSTGNIYLSGQVLGALAGEPFTVDGSAQHFVAKLDPSGNVLWVTHLTLSDHRLTGWGITVGPDGTISTVGYVETPAAYIAQLDSSGNVLSLKAPQLTNVVPYAIAADPSGNLFIAGYTNYNSQAFVAKYTPSADLIWSHVDTSSYSLAQFGSVAVDNQGSAYVSGYRQTGQNCYYSPYSCGFGGTCYNYVCTSTFDAPMWKFNANGQQTWVTTVGNNAEGLGTALDADGNLYCTGFAYGSLRGQPFSGSANAFVAKVIPSNGAIAWVREFGAYQTYGFTIAVAPSDSVFVSGYTNSDPDTGALLSQYDTYISKYDSDGNKQ